MARLLIADDLGIPYVEITDDDDGYRGTCSCGEQINHHRKLDLIEIARVHIDQRH